VAVERFQFFVWTLVGVFTFLFLVVFSDPSHIAELPTIPNGFLALMGVSSFGYLGGKLARKPGPIIDEIVASVGSLTLVISGRKLSMAASFNIDGTDVAKNLVTTVGTDPDEGSSADFFKTLTLTIAEPLPRWPTAGRHQFTITNPDGQNAEWFYRIGVPATK
jgi:hypothetical protein